jgi:hypothetical protein
MGRNVVVEVVVERGIDPLGMGAPLALAFKVKDVVFKTRINRGTPFTEHLDIQILAHKMRIVVDVNIPYLSLFIKAVKVDAFLVILTNIVPYDHAPITALHDPAEPVIVVAVVVLDECIGAAIVGIKGAAIYAPLAHIAVHLIELHLDTVRVEVEQTVARAVSTAVDQCIEFIDGIEAASGNHIVSPRVLDKIACHVHIGPEIVVDGFVFKKLDAPAA